MKKHLLSLALAIPFSSAVMAQAEISSVTGNSDLQYELIPSQTARTPAVEPGPGQLWWANYDLDASIRYIYGTEVLEHYDMAVFIPQGLICKGDASIDGFSFYPQSTAMDNVVVWVANSLPNSKVDMLETVSVAKDDLTLNDFNDVAFSEQHQIPAGGLYVGVSFDITKLSDRYASAPLSYTNTKSNRKDSFFYKTTSKRVWKAIEGDAYVKVLFGGGHFPKNAVTVKDFVTSYAVKDETAPVPLTLRNMGTEDVENISYTITTDGTTSEEVTKAVIIKGFQNSKVAVIDFPADDVPSIYNKQLTITKVNGQPNLSENNIANGQVITVAEKMQATPVAELFVSTKAGGSPCAIAAMDLMKETYGDKAVALAIHCNDVMNTTDYTPVAYNISTLPSALVDRVYLTYPWPSSFVRLVGQQMERTVPAKISLKAEWTGMEISPINIALTSTTTFCYNDSKADYGIAYVIVADGLKGNGAEWYQTNGYSGEKQTGTPDMQPWYDAPETVTDMVYNNVAVAAVDIFGGVKGSVPTSVKNGQELTHTQAMNIKGNTLIQDKTKLRAVALLIDRSSNQIVNAAQADIVPGGQGIENINADETVVASYDLAGRKATAAHKGLTIVKTADGKSTKIVK